MGTGKSYAVTMAVQYLIPSVVVESDQHVVKK